jgi:long-subunit fatty acid transport protein
MILDDYSLKTPGKYTGSLAYVFGKNGLISIDYSLKDYANAKFSNNRYNAINNELNSTLNMVSELRIGAEYRIKSVSIRGGYRYEQSPYKNKKTISDLNGLTGGLGFSFR